DELLADGPGNWMQARSGSACENNALDHPRPACPREGTPACRARWGRTASCQAGMLMPAAASFAFDSALYLRRFARNDTASRVIGATPKGNPTRPADAAA